jgi:ribosomal-protein-alanine N-acetyltransferase
VSVVPLREMRWWDVEALLPVERELFGVAAWPAETFWSELAQKQTRWFAVAESPAGELLGYAGVMLGGSQADVQTLAVLPAAQGRGVGGRLLRALLARAAGSGASAVLLEVRADNAAAIALYGRHGFERLAVRRRYYQPDGVDALVMRLRPLPRPDGRDGPDRPASLDE